MERKPEQQADCLATYAQPERHLMANTAIDFWRPENVRGKCSENLWKFTANEPPYTDELLNVLDLFKSNVIQSGKCWLTQTSNGMVWNLGRSNGACGRGKLTTQQQIELISGSINPNPTGICVSLSLSLSLCLAMLCYILSDGSSNICLMYACISLNLLLILLLLLST